MFNESDCFPPNTITNTVNEPQLLQPIQLLHSDPSSTLQSFACPLTVLASLLDQLYSVQMLQTLSKHAKREDTMLQ